MESIDLDFEETGESLNPIELGEYLFLFNSVYRALYAIDPDRVNIPIQQPTKHEIDSYLGKLKQIPPSKINQFCTQGENDIAIKTLNRNSPMQWTILAMGCFALFAVVLSGGEISITNTGIKAKLPPLGKGIKALKDALRSNPNINTSYGVKGTTVKLTKEELDLLMLQPEETAFDGGFQRFIVGLQFRVNRTTRELELSSYDLDRIFKYKASRSKGGWQSRFHKIFSNHFPDIAAL